MIKRNGARVSPCKTPAKMSKKSVGPSGVMIVALVLRYRVLIAFTSFIGIPYIGRI